MPLYMDRHDIREATADEVASAHKNDLVIQSRHSCKALTYWYEENRGTAFCLIEAPSATAVHDMHKEAHGLIPNQIIEVEASTVAQFLGRIADPETETLKPIQESAFRALMFVDMVSSTDITRLLGDSAALSFVRRYRQIVRETLVENGGREVDRAGDGFLISVKAAYAAAKCAIAIQCRLSKEIVGDSDGVDINARIGIGAGEPVMDGDYLFGSTVNLTSRICDCGEPGQIIAARVVRDLCIGKDVSFRSVGAKKLKGFEDTVELELVAWP